MNTMLSLNTDKRLTERFLQGLSFEALGILLCTPLFSWLMQTPWLDMGVVTVANCVMALIWNMAFNAAFDRTLRHFGIRQSLRTRAIHATLFEAGLIVASVPFAVWWLNISLVSAFLLDIGQLLFFLPYTFVYHWAYDSLRQQILLRTASRHAIP